MFTPARKIILLGAEDILYHPGVNRIVSNATPEFLDASVPAVSTLQTGHGWTATGNAAGDLNYTGDYAPFAGNTQCIKLTNTGTTAAWVTSPRITPIDLRTYSIRIWYKIDAATAANLDTLQLAVGMGVASLTNNETATLVQNNTSNVEYCSKVGVWDYITLDMKSFKDAAVGTVDWSILRDFKFRLGNKTAACTVYFGRIDIIPNNTTFGAHGVITLEFDDGYTSCLTEAAAYMTPKGMMGSVYVIRNLVGTGAYLSLSDYKTLRYTHGWDIAPHADTTTLHNSANGFLDFNETQQRTDIVAVKQWIRNNVLNKGMYIWAIPKGYWNTALLNVADDYFSTARLAKFRTSETFPICDPYRARCVPIGYGVNPALAPNTTPGTLEWMVDRTYTGGGWLRIMMHKLVAVPTVATEYAIADFQTLVDYIETSTIPVKKVSDVLGI